MFRKKLIRNFAHICVQYWGKAHLETLLMTTFKTKRDGKKGIDFYRKISDSAAFFE